MVLGFTFLLSGVSKGRDLSGTVGGVLEYQILPDSIARRLAPLLPAAEIALAALLISGVAVGVAAVGSIVLLAAFSTAVAVNLSRGRAVPCHCFGAMSRERIGSATMIRLGCLASAALLLVWIAAATTSPPGPEPTAAPANLLSIVLSVCVLLALLGPATVVAERVVAVRRRIQHGGARS
jgi:hypothetical protein